MQLPEAPVTPSDALLYLIRHWHDLHRLRRLVIEMADTIRLREGG